MRLAISLFLALGLSACALFKGAGCSPSPSPVPSSAPGHSLGVFHAGPYTDEATGKTCNAPGGFCEDDGACHSSADKCHKH